MLKNIIIQNSYYDSATLMLLTNKIKEQLKLNTDEISIMMATSMNKRILENSNLINDVGRKANSGDLLISIITDISENEIIDIINSLLTKKEENINLEEIIESVDVAIKKYETNFAVVSLPGEYATREVKKLLNANMNVLLFSDNISIEDEIMLKDLAISKNLLMMGADCGTAIINGVGLGFSNKVNRGNIGIVAASGTGLQELACIISNNGGGISNAFGTGGRDISKEVSGRMMLYTLDLLINDDNTKVITIVSKPPCKEVLEKIKLKLKDVQKPIIACFLGANKEIFEGTNIIYAENIFDLAYKSLKEVGINIEKSLKIDKKYNFSKTNKYIRAIYAGGTLAYESLLELKNNNLEVYSNLEKNKKYKLSKNDLSVKHTIIDTGDDEFTVGRPHPMIDPTIRSERFLKEGLDKEVKVLIADVQLGYGSNPEASSILASDILKIYDNRKDIAIIVVLCGSILDYQDYYKQKQILENTKAIIVDSNNKAINIALKLLEENYEK